MANPKHTLSALEWQYENQATLESSGMIGQDGSFPDEPVAISLDEKRSQHSTEDEVALTEEQLIGDPVFQQHADVLFNKFSTQSSMRASQMQNIQSQAVGPMSALDRARLSAQHVPPSTPRGRAEWLVNHYAWFNNNFTAMFVDYQRLQKADLETLKHFVAGLDLYDATPNTTRSIGRAIGYTVPDVANLLGFTMIAKQGVKGVSKTAFKHKLKDIIQQSMTSSQYQVAKKVLTTGGNVALAGGEGASYGGAFMGTEESIRARAAEREFNWDKPKAGALMGTAFGSTIVLGAQLIKWLHGRKQKKAVLAPAGVAATGSEQEETE